MQREANYKSMFRDYPDALTPEQLQEMLGIGRRKTYELLKNGDIHSVRMGRIYRVPKVAIIDYLCDTSTNEYKKEV